MRFIKRAAVALLLLVLLWIGLAASKWLPLTTDVQRKSLAILEAPPIAAKGQHNAFTAIWLMQYEIPEADFDKVMAADLARYRIPKLGERAPDFVSSAEGRYRKQAPPDGSYNMLCKPRDEDCLAKIRDDVDEARSVLGKYSLLIDHARALDSYDYYHDLFPVSPYSPLPEALGVGGLQISDAALRFADGDKAEGLRRACSVSDTWRHLAIHSDSLIVQMLGVANFHGAADLFADMLAEIPADAPLPESCANAFAPIAHADLSICDSMKIEFRMSESTLNQIDAADTQVFLFEDNQRHAPGFVGLLLFNKRATRALSVPLIASYCTRDSAIVEEAGRLRIASVWNIGGLQGILFNPIGNILAAIAIPDYAQYLSRLRDLQTMDKLITADLILRRESAEAKAHVATGVTPEAAVVLPSGVTLDAQQHLVRIRRIYQHRGESQDFTIPLPASRLH